MPRPLRVEFAGARHHVMNRGARHEPVFYSHDSRNMFLELVGVLPDRFGVEVHGYAIMPNHYHLMVRSLRGELSRAMRFLGAEYTQGQNRANRWDGPLFRGRFRSRLVDDDRYWRHLLAYLHLNPVKGGLAARAEEYEWTSHLAYLGLADAPAWLKRGELLASFGSAMHLSTYVEAHAAPKAKAPEGWDADRLWERAPAVCAISETVVLPPVVPPHQAIAEVIWVTGKTEDEIRTSRRGPNDNRARWLAAWWLAHRSQLSNRMIGRYLDTRTDGVTHMFFQLAAADADSDIVRWKKRLEAINPPLSRLNSYSGS